jgi:mannose-6-phosphate isomerase-like protein (cupin superfamily)
VENPANIYSTLDGMDEYFKPEILAWVNDHKIEVVKANGEFVWHLHEDTDDTFLVVHGEITVQLRDRNVKLREGDLFVVPRGVEHCPVAHGEAHVLLFEKADTINTGTATEGQR